MKYPIGSILLMFSIAFANWHFWQTSQTDDHFPNSSDSAFSVPMPFGSADLSSTSAINSSVSAGCPMAAQTVDSLALIDLWNSTGGSSFFWNFPWWNPSSTPVCSWFGITTDNEGYVTHIMLSGHGLAGPLPASIGNLSRLKELRLDNNQLSGTLPTQLGNLINLEVLYVDNNDFIGSVPSSIGNLTKLINFFFDNNQLTGRIPVEFTNLVSLQRFEFFINKIDSLPDLSSLNVVTDRFKVYDNKLTFDDILPNIGLAMGDFYTPQAEVCPFTSVNITTGSNYAIDLGFDRAITSNVYKWYKDGNPVPIATITGNNRLDLSPVTFADAGKYTCTITNPNAPLLTLTTCEMMVNVSCGLSVYSYSDSLCTGQTVTINSTVYSQSNPTDTIPLPASTVDGCDSVIYINLYYPAQEAIGEYRDTICRGDTVYVNGNAYHQTQTVGFDFFPGGSSFGCDSILNVFISLYPNSTPGNVAATICAKDTFYYNGNAFYQGKTSGAVKLPDANIYGCDSTVNVNISFFPEASRTFDQMLCIDDDITINGTVYNKDNPTGRDTLPGASSHGCDSIIIVDLTFENFATGTLDSTLCPGDSLTVNGTVYHSGNLTGMEIFPNASVNGCDSLLTVTVDFYPIAAMDIAPTLCPGDDITVNGSVFNASNPKDTLLLPGMALHGCDSIIYIDLQYHPVVETDYTPDLCPGVSVTVNGTVYNEANPTGTEVFTGATVNGCDSTVHIALSFMPEPSGSFATTLCLGESITINGTTYNESNRTGVERLSGLAANGCDSLLSVSVDFFPRAEGNIMPQVCQGDCININGTDYCSGNPTGIEVLPNAASNGCDSFLLISIVELPIPQGSFSSTLCPGDDIVINGTTYNATKRTGTELLPNAAANGCDSMLMVSISFFDSVKYDMTGSLCFGESIVVNGTTYDENNRTGTEVFPNAAANGCDSIVFIDLDFTTFAAALINPTLCEGKSITVNGKVYNQSNPTGKDTILMGSSSGCDSIITIQLSFHPKAIRIIDTTLCPGENIFVNGTRYDENKLTGQEILPGQATSGCDSTIQVNLSYYLPAEGQINQTLCAGDSLIVNGTVYKAGHTSGTEFFAGGSINGCDSTLAVNIDFFPTALNEINRSICPGQTVTINGKTYDQNNTTGCDTLFAASVNGCDSILKVNITVSTALSGRLDGFYCPDQTFVLNGNTYDISNRTGMETLTSSGGCDSIVTIDLDFYLPANGTLAETWCKDQEQVINGTTYGFSRPAGIEFFPGGSVNGCDSMLTISLNFFPDAEGTYEPTICTGGSIEYQGTVYDKDNSSGTVILENASINGCDSTVTVMINFAPVLTGTLAETWCADQSITINGNVYDVDNPSGTEMLSTADGCDSLLTIALNFSQPAIGNLNETWCKDKTLDINGTTYGFDNPSGTEILENASVNGCDSTLIIQLNFFPDAIAIIDELICEGQEFIFDGEVYTTPGTFDIVLKQPSSNGCDSLVTLNLEITDASDLGLADAGFDQLACDTEAPISGNLPTGTSGEWTCLGSSQVMAASNPSTTVQGLVEGNNLLVWTLSTAACPAYDADTLIIELEALPELLDDNFTLSHLDISADLDVLENDNFDTAIDWTLRLENLPAVGDFELMSDQKILFTPNLDFAGTLDFSYLLCSENCPDRCAEALVQILVEATPLTIDTTVSIPNGITPNGDGLNDAFVIDALVTNPDDYPDNELIIFNRWGDIVYQASPYVNDWEGTNAQGQALPQGTYYYVLRLKLESGEVFKGDVTILK